MIKLILTTKEGRTRKQATTKVDDLSLESEQRIYRMLRSALDTWAGCEKKYAKRRRASCS